MTTPKNATHKSSDTNSPPEPSHVQEARQSLGLKLNHLSKAMEGDADALAAYGWMQLLGTSDREARRRIEQHEQKQRQDESQQEAEQQGEQQEAVKAPRRKRGMKI